MKTILDNLFEKYRTDILIETGSYEGDGIQRALDTGYKKIASIEIHKERYQQCYERFKDHDMVWLFHGDSVTVLPTILQALPPNTKCTFWLDAHLSGISKNCPTLEELDVVFKILPGSNHNILIDDVPDFGTPTHNNITLDDLKKKVLAINPNYKFVIEPTSDTRSALACFIED